MKRIILIILFFSHAFSGHSVDFTFSACEWKNRFDCDNDSYPRNGTLEITITPSNYFYGQSTIYKIILEKRKKGLFNTWQESGYEFHTFVNFDLFSPIYKSLRFSKDIMMQEHGEYDFKIIVHDFEKNKDVSTYSTNELLNNVKFEDASEDGVCYNTLPCETTPSNLSSGNYTINSAYLQWESISGVLKYQFKYKEKNSSTWSSLLIDYTGYPLTGLKSNTTYEYQIRTYCGGSNYSNWSTSHYFTTLPLKPSNGKPQGTVNTLEDYTNTTFSWEGNSLKYQVYLRASGDSYWELVATTYNKQYTYPKLGQNKWEWKVVAIGEDNQETEGPIWKFELTKNQLVIDKETVPLNFSVGSSGSFSIVSNTSWNITGAESWLNVSQLSGSNNATITVQAKSENTLTSNRKCTLTISGGGITKTIEVLQEIKTAYTLSLDKSSLTFSSAKSEFKEFTIYSNTSWKISDKPVWINLSASSSSGDRLIHISTASENTSTSSRSGIVTVKTTDGAITKTILVTQEGYTPTKTLEVAPSSSLSFDDSKHFTAFKVISNTSWTVSKDQTWIECSPISGSGDYPITVNIDTNTSTSSRSGFITVKTIDGSITKTISITQEGYTPSKTLTVSSSSLSLDPYNHSTTFNVISNTSWTVSKDQIWIECYPNSGSGNNSITVTINANTSTSSRSGTISIKTTDGSITKTINVSQAGNAVISKYINLSTPSLTLGSAVNSSGTFNISSNSSWIVSADKAWIYLTPTSGNGNNTVTIKVNSNTSSSMRIGTVHVKTIDGSITKDISVIQAGEAAISSIVILGPNSVNENSSANYSCTAYYSDGTSQDVTSYSIWSNSGNGIISSAGKLTSNEVNSDQICKITASFGEISATKEVIIKNAASTTDVTDIVISGPTSMEENSSANFTCTAYYSDGTTQDVTNSTTWSENSIYSTINANGIMSTTSVNSLQISTITASFGGKMYTQNVSIRNSTASMPSASTAPTPANGAINQLNNVELKWQNGGGATSFKIYFGTDSTPDESEFKGNLTTTGFHPGTLASNTLYYWRVDAVNANGITTGTVWRFQTGNNSENETNDLVWAENFENYSSRSFPNTWIADANATNNSTNFIDNAAAKTGSNSLKLFGAIGSCWGALTYRTISVSPPYYISFDVKNGSEQLSGCHPDRASIGLRKGTSWANPARALVDFKNDGKIYTDNNKILSYYSENTWNNVLIKYERTSPNQVKTTFWIDNKRIYSLYSAAIPEENELTHLQLAVQEGSAWFDNVAIYKSMIITSIKNNLYKNSIKLYPNPTDDILNIQFTTIPKKYTIGFYNNLGQLLIQKESSNQLEKLDLNGIISGLYFLKISNNEFSITEKIIVK